MSGGAQEGRQSVYTMTNVIVTGAYKRNKALLTGEYHADKQDQSSVRHILLPRISGPASPRSATRSLFSPPPRCVAVQSPAALFSRPPPAGRLVPLTCSPSAARTRRNTRTTRARRIFARRPHSPSSLRPAFPGQRTSSTPPSFPSRLLHSTPFKVRRLALFLYRHGRERDCRCSGREAAERTHSVAVRVAPAVGI